MRVALDTNIFYSDRSLNGGHFEVLTRLAEAGYVEIFIPEVVAKEFTSPSSEQHEAVAKLQERVKEFRLKFPRSLRPRIDALKEEIKALVTTFESEAQGTFNSWMQRVRGQIVGPGVDHAQRVLTKYFDGSFPFGSRKARTDFPDAFVAEIILDLAADQELVFVAADSRVQKAFTDIPNVTVFPNLEGLLKSEGFVAIQNRFDLAANLSRIALFINEDKNVFSDAFLDSLSNDAKFAHYKGRDDEEDLYIDVLEEIVEWTLETDDAEYLGEGVISIPFEAVIDGSVDEPMDFGMDWYPYFSRPTIDARVNVGGVCSFIIDPLDLVDPETCLEVEGGLDRVRLQVEEIHFINVMSTAAEENGDFDFSDY